jgi:hypothetical protein
LIKKSRSPRQYSLVRFDFEGLPIKYHKKYPFKKNEVYVYFGEISNMRGHCIVANHKTGKIHSGYHIENFIELTEDEA